VSTAIGTRAVLETWSCSCDRLSHCAKHVSASPGKGDPVAWCRGAYRSLLRRRSRAAPVYRCLGERTFDVLDIRKGERSTEIKGLSEPQGVFYSSQNDELYVASGGDGTLRIYDETTLKLRQTLEFGADADNVRYGGHSEDLRRQKPSFTKSCNLRDDGPTKHVSRADPGLQCCATSKVSACQVSGLRHSERTRCVPLK
jgi:hypothetical protein